MVSCNVKDVSRCERFFLVSCQSCKINWYENIHSLILSWPPEPFADRMGSGLDHAGEVHFNMDTLRNVGLGDINLGHRHLWGTEHTSL